MQAAIVRTFFLVPLKILSLAGRLLTEKRKGHREESIKEAKRRDS